MFILGEDAFSDLEERRRQVVDIILHRPRRGREFLLRHEHGDWHSGHAGKFCHKQRDTSDCIGRAVIGELEEGQVRSPLVMVGRYKLVDHL